MRVFISWSGELSRQLAEAVRNWLPSALQYVRPYFTPADVDKGAKWATEIFKELSSSTVCIIVLTRENLNSNWIMFEAGAISSTIDQAKVCPIIFDLEPTDLQGPLAQFQVTKFVKDDILRLFTTINSGAGENKLSDAVADAVFQKWWPDLEAGLKSILDGHLGKKSGTRVRSERDLIEEILLLTRTLASVKAVDTQQNRATPKYDGSIYQKLTHALTYYDANYVSFGDDETEMHQMYLELQNEISRRLSNSDLRAGMLKDIGALIERTKPKPKKKQKTDADEIPF